MEKNTWETIIFLMCFSKWALRFFGGEKVGETSMFKKPQRFDHEIFILKVPGKIKTDNNLNIRRKLKVAASLLLLLLTTPALYHCGISTE